MGGAMYKGGIMKAFFDRSAIAYQSVESREAVRRQAAERAKRIAEALRRAADAAFEMSVAGCAKVRAEKLGTDRARRVTGAQLQLAMLAQLRECANVAQEMQMAVNEVLTGWVLADDVSGTGLGCRELRTLLDVAGYNS